jgi:hypothetical protein
MKLHAYRRVAQRTRRNFFIIFLCSLKMVTNENTAAAMHASFLGQLKHESGACRFYRCMCLSGEAETNYFGLFSSFILTLFVLQHVCVLFMYEHALGAVQATWLLVLLLVGGCQEM